MPVDDSTSVWVSCAHDCHLQFTCTTDSAHAQYRRCPASQLTRSLLPRDGCTIGGLSCRWLHGGIDIVPRNKRANYVAETIATYDAIAADYKLTATPEMRAWEENSMRRFSGYLMGTRVLVPGCGDGRDSRFLRSLGLTVDSFDLSVSMLGIARAHDPEGNYFLSDLREIHKCPRPYDGIFASGCLYHLTKTDFAECVRSCRVLLSSRGVFYFNMKEGHGERIEDQPGPRYPGGMEAQRRLRGPRFYAYYQRDELLSMLSDFEILHEQKLLPGDGGFEFWMRKPDDRT